MVRRSNVGLDEIATLDNLALAYWNAARGKRTRSEVRRYAGNLDGELEALRLGILNQNYPVGRYATFRIFDPKPRLIHAPCFRERVLHHALIAKVGPVLDRALVDDTFACRTGKGAHAAALRAQQHVRRFPWYGQIDIRAYFASIDHARLHAMLTRRFKHPGLLHLLHRILQGQAAELGRGLPIGALTSQHFANLYLSPLDRFLLEELRLPGIARYMDDSVFFGHSRQQVHDALHAVHHFAEQRLGLTLRPDYRLQRSQQGLSFVGFRIFAGTIRLSRRRAERYRRARRRWEDAYLRGAIDARTLQAGYASALAITALADSRAYRKLDLARRPPPDV